MSISTRVLRKFTGDSDLINNFADDGSDIDDSPFSSGVKKNQLSANRYDLLNEQLNSESECKGEYEDDDDENDENDENDEKSGFDNSHERRPKEITKRKKKKKKKSLKAAQKQSINDVDEVERSVQEVNAILGETSYSCSAGSSEKDGKKGILSIEPRHLNPKNELKRIFGSNVVEEDGGSKRKQHGRRKLKTFSVIEPRDNWPPLNKYDIGITMTLFSVEDGIHYFGFEHSSNYQNVEKECMDAVDSVNPANLMMVVNKAPYHADTLIQVSEILKTNEDLPMAAELIERALYSMESVFHPLFSLSKNNCRLLYVRQENRSLYVALFKHMMFVGQKACYRTALEFSKVIFNLEPKGDPLAIVLILDFYALRSREFEWFLNFVEELDGEKNLSQLPNIAFSKAVALFELSDPRADETLQDALLMFPNVLFPLLQKCGVESDAKTCAHPYFNVPYSKRMRALNLLVDLYVERNFHIWKDRNLISWLEKNSLKVIERVDNKDPLVEEYAAKRARRFEACLPRNIDRHVILSDFKSTYSIIDQDTWYAFDPLPPRVGIAFYGSEFDSSDEDEDATNLFALYFRSLLPSFDVNQMSDEEYAQDAQGGENNRRSTEFNGRMRTLVGAMRNLLSNLPLGENRNRNSSDEEGSDNNGRRRAL